MTKADLQAAVSLLEVELEVRSDRVVELEEALRSIAANSCCAQCREAGLVALASLNHGGDALVSRITGARRHE